MFSKIFIYRPRFAVVISLVIMIAGLITMKSIPVAQLPEVVPPSVSVSTSYPGASAEVIEQTVAQVIESQVNGVDNMIYMESSSADDGSYSLRVTFLLGTDPDMNTVNVQNRINQISTKLPEEVQRQGVTVKKNTTSMLLGFALYSPDQSRDMSYLANYMTITVKDALSRVTGVGEVNTFGDTDYSMRVWLDMKRLASLGLTNKDVINAISAQNVQPALGSIGSAPAPKDQQIQLTLKSKGRLKSAEEIGNIVLRSNADGGLLRLKDVSRVELGRTTYAQQSMFNGKIASGGMINLAPGANAVEVAQKVHAELKRLAQFFPEGVAYSIIFDTSTFVNATIEEVVSTLFEAFVLVLLTVYLSLGTFRATLIPMCAIPVSLVGTFIFMAAFGMSANTVSLLSLVLVIGIVVDDAICVTENAMRIIEEEPDLPVPQCVEKAMKQITGAVIATTLVLLSVFVPVAFVPGISGQLYMQFAITVCFSMSLSTLNALTLSPALCAVLLRHEKKKEKGFVAWVLNGIDVGRDKYTGVVRHLVKRYRLSILFIMIAFAGAWFMNDITPAGFLPDEDQGVVMADVQLPAGASLNRTQEVLEQTYQIAAKHPAVDQVMTVGGFGLLSGNGPNSGLMMIGLKPYHERQNKSLQAQAVIENLQAKFSKIQAAQIRIFNLPAIPGIGMANGFDYRLQNVAGEPLADMEAVMRKLLMTANQSDKIGMAYSTFTSDTPQMLVDVDRVKAEVMGVSVADVFSQMQSTFGYYYVNDFTLNGRIYKVNVQADAKDRNIERDIYRVYVKNNKGQNVPLRSLITLKPVLGPQVLTRYNNTMTIKINGVAAHGISSGQAMDAMEKVSADVLPKGYAYEWTGVSLQEKEAAGQTATILALAFLFTYFFLVALYESWMLPLPILLSVPVGLCGALMFLYFGGLTNNIYAQIGLVILIGQCSKNAILIVEFAKVRVEEGLDPEAAAIEASYLRFRAVMMTAVSFLLGLIPLVIATGAGAVARRSVGTAVFGGMTVATFIGILVVPMLFVVFVRRRQKFHTRRNRRIEKRERKFRESLQQQ